MPGNPKDVGLFYAIGETLYERGVRLGEIPSRIFQETFQNHDGAGKWELIANGNREQKTVKADQWGDVEVPAFGFAILWNGWLAGIVDAAGGIMANGEAANMESFLKSFHEKSRREKGEA